MVLLVMNCPGQPGSNGCPEDAGDVRHDAEDSHAGVTAGWGELIRSAEAKGWARAGGAGPFRCPACAARAAGISGHGMDVWEAAIARYVAGDRAFLGQPGMPSRREFWNAVTHRPAWMERIKSAPSYKPKAGPPKAEHLASIVGRLEAGEGLGDICTGRDGWPSMTQWRAHAKAHPEVRDRADAVIRARAAGRAAVARSRKQPSSGRRRPASDPAAVAARAAARQAKAAERAAAAEARARQKQEAAAERSRRAAEAAAELVRRREADRVRRKAERDAARAEAAAELAAIKEEDRRRREAAKESDRQVRREIDRLKAEAAAKVRARADTPEERFRARTAPADAKGCRMWRGGKRVRFDWWVRELLPQDAALMLAGKEAAGKGMMTVATCGNPDCVTVDHLAIVPKPNRRIGPPKSPAVDPVLLAIAGDIIADRHVKPGTKGRHLTGRRRGRPELATARQILQYVLNTEYAYTAEAVAKVTGRERTSVSHALQAIEDRRDDADFDHRLDETCRIIAEGYQAIARNDQ